jgi:LysR family transcriptional regulator, hca operon transcriptional activator
MELRLLRYFVAVAEELSITRAAEHLHTAQPSLSQQIRQLEDIVGSPLFHRDKHRLRLTESGTTLLPEAKQILAATADAILHARLAARHEAGTISIGMVPGPEGKVFSSLIPLFLRANPDVQLLLRTCTAPEQIQALLKREINVGFLRGPIEEDEIASEIYMREPVVAVIPQSWELAKLDRIPVQELAKMPLISISRAVAPAVHDIVGVIAERAGVQFQMRFCTENLLTSMNAVASGLGFCFFSAYVEEIVPKGVVTRPIDLDPVPQLDLLFAYRRDDTLSPLSNFLSIIREHAPFRVHAEPA